MIVRVLGLLRSLILLPVLILGFTLLLLCHLGLRLIDTTLCANVTRKKSLENRNSPRPMGGRRELTKGADQTTERLSARRFVPLAIVLVLWALVPIVPLFFLGLNWIVAHPLRVISLLLIMLTLLFVGY